MVDIGKLLGKGREGEVFAYGEFALKVNTGAFAKSVTFKEAANLAAIECFSLPVPRVRAVGQFDDRWGLVLDRVNGQTFVALVSTAPEQLAACLRTMARLHLSVNACSGEGFPSFKSRLRKSIAGGRSLAAGDQRALLAKLEHMPDGTRLCHGDLHPENVIGDASHAMIIDWLNVSAGEPALDLARSFMLFFVHEPDLAQAYLEAYVAEGGEVTAEAVWRWLPFVAAARLSDGHVEEEVALRELIAAAFQ